MAEYILTANLIDKPSFVEGFEDFLINTREDELDTIALQAQVELLEVVNTRRIDERHLTHTDDTHLLLTTMGATADIVELVGNTEEVRTIYLIYLGIERYLEGLEVLAMELEVVVVRWIEFAGERLHCGGLVGALEEEDDCQQKAYLDSNGEVKENSENESHQHDDEVGLRVFGKPHDGAELGHVVADHNEDTRKASHRDEGYQWSEEKQDSQEQECVYNTCNRGLTTVVDIGHRTSNSTRSRDTTKERHYHIGHTLGNELGIGVVAVANHTIRHHSREQ